MYLASLCPSGALCNVNVHVYAKPPFYLVFVLFWFCSDTCQNETLRQQLQGGSAAVFPFGFGIAFAPRGTKEARWASPFPSASPTPGGGAVGLGPLQPWLPTGLSPPSPPQTEALAPGLEGRQPPASTHTLDRWAWERGRPAWFSSLGENVEFHARCLCIISII